VISATIEVSLKYTIESTNSQCSAVAMFSTLDGIIPSRADCYGFETDGGHFFHLNVSIVVLARYCSMFRFE